MLSAAGPKAAANGVSLIGDVGDVTMGVVGPSHSKVQSQADASGSSRPAPMLTSLKSQEIELTSTGG